MSNTSQDQAPSRPLSNAFDDPTQGREVGHDPHGDATEGNEVGHKPNEDATDLR